MKIDGKHLVVGEVMKVKDGSIIDPDEIVIFRVHDNAFYTMVRRYPEACRGVGADPRQIEAAELMVERIERWRAKNPSRCKNPDIAPGETMDIA